MATGEQIKSLIRSHWSEDPERFYTLALQVAAYEAQQGHGSLAVEIRTILDRARRDAAPPAVFRDLPPDLSELIRTEDPSESWASLVLPSELVGRIKRISSEFRQRTKLKSHGLTHRRKVLLTGPPGTGKTMTARVIAHDLGLPLMVVQVDRLVSKYLGETSAKLRQVFDLVSRCEGVYLFDEFDALGGGRHQENEVGEMRRVLTALLQFIEQDRSDSVIVAATNTPELLDRALFRRFDDVLPYRLPSDIERRKLIANTLGTFMAPSLSWKVVLSSSDGLSSADIVHACYDALKSAVLADEERVAGSSLIRVFKERHTIHSQ